MIRVVVIEDRVLMLKALRISIAWADHNLDPIGFFENCDEALPFILAEKPDVVVTDIVMHGLSGIELCERLRREGLDTQLIIISAYSRFEYAQKALQMGVFDYFEKPIDFDLLVDSICRAGEERRNAEQMRQYIVNHMGFYRERFFVKLLTGQIEDGEAVESEASFLGLDAHRKMCCLTLRLYPLQGEALRRGMRREMTFLSLFRRIEAALGAGGLLGPFSLGENDMTLVLQSDAAYHGKPESVSETLPGVLEQFSLAERLRIHAGIGREVSGLAELKSSYDHALEAAEACFLFSDSTLLTGHDIPRRNNNQWRVFIRFEEALIKALRQEDALAVVAAFNSLRAEIQESYIRRDSLKVLMKSTLIKAQTAYPLDETLLADAMLAIDATSSVDELIEVVQRHAGRICETIHASGISERARLFAAMREYIQNHFSDPHFNLADVARHVAMSPNYVCSLFKKEHGCGLHEYVTELRIERACQLLKQTDIGVGRIGEMVGYPNSYYFSVTFKKNTQYTPTEYRRRNQINQPRRNDR